MARACPIRHHNPQYARKQRFSRAIAMPVGLRILRALARLRSVVVGATGLLFAHNAAAAGIAIRYQAPETCGTQSDFEAGVSRIVGKPISELNSAWAAAEVLIAPDADAFRLRVRVVSENGSPRERDLLVASCHEALQAAELIVATNLSAPPPQAEPEAEPAQSAPTAKHPRLTIEDRPTKPGQSSTPARSSMPLHALLGVRFGLDPLLAPSAVAMGSGMLGLESSRLRLELTAGATSHASSAVAGGGAVKSSWLGAGLLGCYAAIPGRPLELWLCAGGEGGRFRAAGQSGMNLLDAHTSDSFWSAALAQAELLVHLTRSLSLAFGAQGVAALRSVHVTEHNPQTGETVALYSTPRLSVRPWLGVDVRF